MTLEAFLLNKIPVAKWLAVNVVLWGIVEACTAAAHNYSTLLAARILLGIFEASIGPSLALLSSRWYTKSEQAPRFALWFSGLGLAQIIGGIISFAFQHVTNPSFNGWKAMFVALGCATIIVGLITGWILPGEPMSAHFLSDAEKYALLQHVSANQTGVVNRRFKSSHILEALQDPQLWLLTLLLTLVCRCRSGNEVTLMPGQNACSSGVVTTYSATVISGFGYRPSIVALLNAPSGVVSVSSVLISGWGIRHTSNRWAWQIAVCVPGIIGAGLMSFSPKTNKAGLLAGVYLENATVASMPIAYQWTAANVAGHTKRCVSVALLTAGFGVANIIGPQTFRSKDAPQYIPAKITVLATQAAAVLVAIILFGYYRWANWRRDHRGRMHPSLNRLSDAEKWRNLTDKENPDFRYVY